MSKISLLIDIQTILKMAKFDKSFRHYLRSASFLTPQLQETLDRYIQDTDSSAKSTLWGFLSVEEFIVEVNNIIEKWRKETDNFNKIEYSIELQDESELGHNVIGKVLEFEDLANKYKKLILEEKKQDLQYNGFKIIPNGVNGYRQLFF